MAITVFNDVILPNSIIAAGVRGKQIRKNTRVTAHNGTMRINIDWDRTLREYEVGFCPMVAASWRELEGFHEVTEGGAYGFLMADPKDSEALSTEGKLYAFNLVQLGTPGVGHGEPTYKTWKRVEAVGTARFKDRPITRPRTGAVFRRAGSPMVSGGNPGQYTVNLDTGTLTMVADNSQAHSSITVGSNTVLNYSSGAFVATLAVNDRLYITGVTGTAAATLNNKSHLITAEGATSFTISTGTVGLTASGGTSFKYPQASETMTWEGLFYVPVHFLKDEIDWDMVASGPSKEGRFIAGPAVILMEIRE